MFAASSFSQQTAPPAKPAVQPGREEGPARPRVVQPGAIQQQATNFRGPNQNQSSDQTLASCVAIENQEEVAVAQLAWEKTGNKDVKQFSKMIIDDHQAFLKKLEKYAPEAAREGYLNQTSSTSKAPAPAPTATPTPTPAPAPQNGTLNPQRAGQPVPQPAQQPAAQVERHPAAGLDMVQLHREIAQQCLADTKKRLADIDEDKFDHCFIGHQIGRHEAMKTQLTVFQRHASGEFAQLLADGVQTTERHLKQAEKIMDQLHDAEMARNGNKTANNRE